MLESRFLIFICNQLLTMIQILCTCVCMQGIGITLRLGFTHTWQLVLGSCKISFATGSWLKVGVCQKVDSGLSKWGVIALVANPVGGGLQIKLFMWIGPYYKILFTFHCLVAIWLWHFVHSHIEITCLVTHATATCSIEQVGKNLCLGGLVVPIGGLGISKRQ